MDLKDMLLFYSFSQLKGVSEQRERDYWAEGKTLSSLADCLSDQQSLFDDGRINDISDCIQALQKENTDFFLDRTEHRHLYRIAYSFPRDVMFLDIETTGLSTVYHYVTCVGWLLNGEYGYWFQGTDSERFLTSFRAAKMIVTFNGTRFDCRFLDQAFQSSEFSQKANLDLMFLCRRFGLSGGQKAIEQELGFHRPESLKEADGKEAIALWYSFLFGKRSALKRLINYNFYDVLGMAYILDRVFFDKIYGLEFPTVGRPQPFYKNTTVLKLSRVLPPASVCTAIRKIIKAEISNFSRESLRDADNYRIVGIDLAGKTDSRTGLCLLVGSMAWTEVAHTDESILRFVEEVRPDIISIDAPLSLPNGRSSVYDDDPARDSAGIMRYCERELKRRNVNCYPALIRSMQELTRRGIDLAARFRKKGYPVIECFPGAAQDVVQLPRKRTDEALLKTGLSRFGIKGRFQEDAVCHDELDAITASLVGQFFISRYYEPLGIPEENDMIIPQRERRAPTHALVIGLAGLVAAGKTTVGNYLKEYNYHYIRYSQIIEKDLSDHCQANGRDDLRVAGVNLFQNNGQYALNHRVADEIAPFPRVVVDGMRHLEDYTFWKERCFSNFILIFIDTDYELRAARFAARGDENTDYDTAAAHPAEAGVPALRDKADYIIENNGTLDELYTSVHRILEGLV